MAIQSLRPIAASLFLVGFALGGSACSPANEGTREAAQANETRPNWRQLPDGSFVEGYASQSGQGGFEVRRRCWPDARGFDCLHVMYSGLDGGGMAERWQTQALPKRYGDAGMTPDPASVGYHCQFLTEQMAVIETVVREGGERRENTIRFGSAPNGRPWIAREVATLIPASPKTHFDCPELAAQIAADGIHVLEGLSLRAQVIHAPLE